MNALSPDSDDEPVVKKNEPVVKKKSNTRKLKIALGLAAVILVPTIGSALAGTITIGSGPVEFGQGLAATAACGNVTLIPGSSFDNDDEGYEIFELGTITLLIPAACTTKTFTIKAWGASSDTAVPLTSRTGGGAVVIIPTVGVDTCSITIPTSPITFNESVTSCTTVFSVATALISLASPLASAADIYKFTVETS